MDNKERFISDCESKIVEAESVIRNNYLEISEAVFALKEDAWKGSLILDLLKDIRRIDKDLSKERKRIDIILTKVERTDEINAIRDNLREKIRTIEKDNISNYETIGRAAYAAFTEGTLPEENYRGYFEEIIKVTLKIDNIKEEIERIARTSEGRKFFDKVKSGARTLYLKNSCSSSRSLLARQYKKAGEKICNSELIMNLETASLENVVKPYKENLKGLQQLEQEEIKLSNENAKLRGDLEGLGVQASAMKTISEIEDNVNNLYHERRELQIEAGRILSENRKDPLAKMPELKEILKEIDKKEKEVDGLNNEITRSVSEIAIERQNKEIDALKKKINGYNEKITNFNQETDALKEQIIRAEENIKRLKEAGLTGEEE